MLAATDGIVTLVEAGISLPIWRVRYTLKKIR